MEQQIAQFFTNSWVVLPMVFWNAIWKGLALWKAATNKHLSWFVIFMFVNLFGLLEIAYIFKLNKYELGSKKLLDQVQKIFKKKA